MVEIEWPDDATKRFEWHCMQFVDGNAPDALMAAEIYAEAFVKAILPYKPYVTVVVHNMATGNSVSTQVLNKEWQDAAEDHS